MDGGNLVRQEIRFVQDGELLAHEFESFGRQRIGVAWVRTLPIDVEQAPIYMYSGNGGGQFNQNESPAQTWDGFDLAMHMGDLVGSNSANPAEELACSGDCSSSDGLLGETGTSTADGTWLAAADEKWAVEAGEALTAIIWFKTESDSDSGGVMVTQTDCVGWQVLIDTDGLRGVFRTLDSAGRIGAACSFQDPSQGGELKLERTWEDGQWNMATIVVDRQTDRFTLCLNDSCIPSIEIPKGTAAAAGVGAHPLYVGTGNDGANFPGEVDEARILPRAMTPDEISLVYRSHQPGFAVVAPAETFQ